MCIWQFQYRLRTLNSIVPTKLTNKTGINEFRRGPACIFQSTWEYYGIFIGLPMAPIYGMSFIRRKKTKWRTAQPEGVGCPTLSSKGRFLRAISGRLANRFGSRFWKNPKLLRGVLGPISTPNDYLNTVFNDIDVITLCESCRNNAHGPHRKSLNLLQFSPCVWKVFPEYVTCRSPSQIETYSLG